MPMMSSMAAAADTAASLPAADLRVDRARLIDRIDTLAQLGAVEGGGVCRLALTDDDRAGRDLVVSWMRDLEMDVVIDAVGNVIATWGGDRSLAPVMCGSHIDTVRTGGKYDGNYGVLAGLEVVETLAAAGYAPERPISVAFFTDEEGARYHPDMLGSLVYAGGMSTEAALDIQGIDGTRLGDELARIGYAGTAPCPGVVPHRYVEVHIEQGPILEAAGVTIGAVTSVQGIHWEEISVVGRSSHAGTTPMSMRRDAAFAAAAIATRVRDITREIGGAQVGTVGSIDVHPNLVNVVAARATLTVDLRNTDRDALRRSVELLAQACDDVASTESVEVTRRVTADFDPVDFDPSIVDLVERTARDLGHSVQRMPSGAGHDAQMLARVCPAGMIFVPSVGGLSHNVAEFTEATDLEAGANVLLHVMLTGCAR
jgi:beta-ureidopropionase / N-carbamoyl-L-amino-acid hydrolase